jgi:EAL domain-containing protein (putative c-di-GMP-specific phosphodiesterase class I)
MKDLKHKSTSTKRFVLMALFITAFAFTAWLIVNFKNILIQEKEALAVSFADAVLPALLLNDVDQVNAIMKTLEKYPGVQVAELVASDGRTVAAYARPGQSDNYYHQPQFELASSIDDHRLHVMVPVSYDTQIVANLYLSIDLWAASARYVAWGAAALLLSLTAYVLVVRMKVKLRFERVGAAPTSKGPPSETREEADVKLMMRKALAEANISVKYQPIARLSDGGIFGVEAMVSWHHPSGRELLVSPAQFSALAQKMDLSLPFGDWVIDTACKHVASLSRQFGPLALSFNISRAELMSSSFPHRVRQMCARHAYPHQFVELELYEAELAMGVENAVAAAQNFVQNELSLTIDRFGETSYAASLLDQFPVSKVKLATDATEGIEMSTPMHNLCRFAVGMGVQVMAQGVCSEMQRQELQKNGVILGQGTHYSEALTAAELSDFMQNDHVSASMKPELSGQSQTLWKDSALV